MKKLLAGALVLLMLLAVGCNAAVTPDGEGASSEVERTDTFLSTDSVGSTDSQPAENGNPTDSDAATEALRKQLTDSGKDLAVAYLGYKPEGVTVWSYLESTGYGEILPFLKEIPESYVCANATKGEVYCFLPQKADGETVIYAGNITKDGTPAYDEAIFGGTGVRPVLVICNADASPDTLVTFGDGLQWHPCLDSRLFVAGDGILDLTPYAAMLLDRYETLKKEGWTVPTAEDLANTSWKDDGYTLGGNPYLWQMDLQPDAMYVRWNLGDGGANHELNELPWSSEVKDGIAVLRVDFGDFAGKRAYNVLLDKESGRIYVAVDTTSDDVKNDGEILCRFLRATELGVG